MKVKDDAADYKEEFAEYTPPPPRKKKRMMRRKRMKKRMTRNQKAMTRKR